jgi:hypothetical protein
VGAAKQLRSFIMLCRALADWCKAEAILQPKGGSSEQYVLRAVHQLWQQQSRGPKAGFV